MCIIILDNQERTLSFLAAKSTIKDSKYVMFDIKNDDITCTYMLLHQYIYFIFIKLFFFKTTLNPYLKK